jgi:hypothetical protein
VGWVETDQCKGYYEGNTYHCVFEFKDHYVYIPCGGSAGEVGGGGYYQYFQCPDGQIKSCGSSAEAQGKVVFPTKGVIPVPPNYQEAFKIAFPVISNVDEVVQAWKDGKPATEVEKVAKWILGKEIVDLWQMNYAKPLDKMPLQMLIEQIEAFFPAQ